MDWVLMGQPISGSFIQDNGSSGGVGTGLVLSLLSSGTVDAVCALQMGEDIFDPRPVIITDPEKIPACSGSLFCGSILTADWVVSAVQATPGMKIAAVVKGCDAKVIVELVKRNILDRDDLYPYRTQLQRDIFPHTNQGIYQGGL